MSGNYSTPRWRKLRATFRLDCERRQLPCGICRQPIDYRLKHPDPDGWHPDHVKPALHRSPTRLENAWTAYISAQENYGVEADDKLVHKGVAHTLRRFEEAFTDARDKLASVIDLSEV